MPIRISGQGSGRPYIRYTPQANAWMQAGLDGPEEIQDITSSPLCLDITRLELGWMMIAEGDRQWHPWPSPTVKPRPAKPDGDYKIGFLIQVYAPKLIGDVVHDWSSNTTASTRMIEKIYNEVEPDLDPKKALLVRITGSKPLKIGKGTTREIQYEIVKWVPRPAAFDADPSSGNGANAEDEDDMFQKKPGPRKPPSPPSPPKSVPKPAPRAPEPIDEADEF